MHRRDRGGHPAVAFVFDQTQCAGFGDRKIHATDAHGGGFKFATQHFASDGGQRVNVFGVLHAWDFFGKEFGNLFFVFVDRRHDDMTRRFAINLDNVLAQVTLKRFDIVFGEVVIQMAFLRHHRFTLDHMLGVVALADLQNNLVRLRGSFGPMHLDPIFLAL